MPDLTMKSGQVERDTHLQAFTASIASLFTIHTICYQVVARVRPLSNVGNIKSGPYPGVFLVAQNPPSPYPPSSPSYKELPGAHSSVAIIFLVISKLLTYVFQKIWQQKSIQNPNNNFMRSNILKCVHSIYICL